jgi:hypothetical protein
MRSLRPACPIGMENLSAPQLENLRHHPLFSIPKLQGVDCHSLKAEWLARLEAREPDHLRDVQIELFDTARRESRCADGCLRRRRHRSRP